jgi:hypothetical protein
MTRMKPALLAAAMAAPVLLALPGVAGSPTAATRGDSRARGQHQVSAQSRLPLLSVWSLLRLER